MLMRTNSPSEHSLNIFSFGHGSIFDGVFGCPFDCRVVIGGFLRCTVGTTFQPI
jgi:hypothetical protein